jgi:tripartite-type tricarboxylate transporter receptor subunit TctC
MKAFSRVLLGLLAFGLAGHAANAQDWPAKQPIRIIVPYPPGGNADVGARAVAEIAAARLKQVIIIDNRPGASSIIGTEVVSRAAPDGYTLGVVSDSHAINQAISTQPKAAEILGSKVPYDAVRNFVPVAGLIDVPLVLAVNPAVPARTLKELIRLTQDRKSGEGVNFGSLGSGSAWSVQMYQLAKLTKVNYVDVPYKGLAPAATDLISGHIQAMILPVHYAQQYVKAGKIVAIATLSERRHALLPDTPSLAESGFPGQNFTNTLWFIAPAGTPPAIVDRISREFNTAVAEPGMKEKLATAGDPYPATPAELSRRLRSDIDSYGSTIKDVLK